MPQTVTIPVFVLKKLQTAAKAAVEAQDSIGDPTSRITWCSGLEHR